MAIDDRDYANLLAQQDPSLLQAVHRSQQDAQEGERQLYQRELPTLDPGRQVLLQNPVAGNILQGGNLASRPLPTPGAQEDIQGQIATLQQPEPPGAGRRFLTGLAFGLAGAGRDYLLRQYDEAHAAENYQRQIHAGIYNDMLRSGVPITPQLGKALGLKPDQVQQANLISAAQAFAQQQQMAQTGQLMQQFMGEPQPAAAPGGPGVLAAGAPPPPPGAPPAPPPGAPSTAPAPLTPSAVLGVPAVRPSASLSVKTPSGATMTLSRPGVTPEQQQQMAIAAAAESRAAAKFPLDQRKELTALDAATFELQKKKFEFQEAQNARDAIDAQMKVAAAAKDVDAKRNAFEEAARIALKGGLDKDFVTFLKNAVPPKPPTVDLGIPHEAEAIASTGLNPKTNEPVEPKVLAAAKKIVADREAVKLSTEARLQGMRDASAEKKTALGLSMRALAKTSEDVSAFDQRVKQVQGALDYIEKNKGVFAKTVPGIMGAQVAKWTQTARGQVIRNIEQALNILQSAEARFMGGEKGRIPYQLEQQWRAALSDPTKVTQATAQGLIDSTRARLGDMTTAKNEAVQRHAQAARAAGVNTKYVDAFVKGDTEALTSTLNSLVGSDLLPPVISPRDLR